MVKKCWICGGEITESAVNRKDDEMFYLEFRLVDVRRPYAKNYKWKPAYICHKCAASKVGVSFTGVNLNRLR